METQEQLDKWIKSCLNYYNKKSINKMKTVEERLLQLETAHSRLFNQLKDVVLDIEIIKNRNGNTYLELSNKINDLKELIQPKDEVPVLPNTLVNGKEYKAVISDIIKSTPTKWKNMEYTNWEVKIVGKEEYVFIAFIPTEHQLQPGDKVVFSYAHPFQLKKLKQI